MRLTKDVTFWKKQVEDVREEQNSTLKTNISKIDQLEAELDLEKKRVRDAKLEKTKIIEECDLAKRANDEKIRAACDVQSDHKWS